MTPSISNVSAKISAFHCTRPFMLTNHPASPRSFPMMASLDISTSHPAIFTSQDALFWSFTLPPAARISPDTGLYIRTSPQATMRSCCTFPLISTLPPATIALSPMFHCITSSPQARTRSHLVFPVTLTFPQAAYRFSSVFCSIRSVSPPPMAV